MTFSLGPALFRGWLKSRKKLEACFLRLDEVKQTLCQGVYNLEYSAYLVIMPRISPSGFCAGNHARTEQAISGSILLRLPFASKVCELL